MYHGGMADTNPNTVSIDPRKLRRLRTERLWTRQRLARESGVSVAGIAKIENGKREQPRLETIRKLRDALGCDLKDLKPDEEPAA